MNTNATFEHDGTGIDLEWDRANPGREIHRKLAGVET